MLLHVRLLYQKFCMKWTLLGLLCVVQRKMGDTDGSSADSDQSALFGELKITINWLDQPTTSLERLHCCYVQTFDCRERTLLSKGDNLATTF